MSFCFEHPQFVGHPDQYRRTPPLENGSFRDWFANCSSVVAFCLDDSLKVKLWLSSAVAQEGLNVLRIVFSILLTLSLLMAVTAGALGGIIHFLLAVAVGSVLVQFLQSRGAV
jgi:hypothetical protein